MARLALAVGLVVAVALVAAWINRRRATAAGSPPGHHVPDAVDRDDFPGADLPWLVAVFTSATCDSCAATWERAALLRSDQVAVQEVEVGAEPTLHTRYGIDAVPTTVVCDDEGVVRASFLGPVTSTHLWGALAEVREPGTVPPGCSAGE